MDKVTVSEPGAAFSISLTPEGFAQRIFDFCKANGITTEEGLTNYINGLSSLAGVRAVVREILTSLTEFGPPPPSV